MASETLETVCSDMVDRNAKGQFVKGNRDRAGKGNQRARKYSREAQEKMQAVDLANDCDRDAKGRFVKGNRYRFQRGNKKAWGFGNLAWNRYDEYFEKLIAWNHPPFPGFDDPKDLLMWSLECDSRDTDLLEIVLGLMHYEKRKNAYAIMPLYRKLSNAYNALHRRRIKADIAEVGESDFDAIVESMHKTARRVLPERMRLEIALNHLDLSDKMKERIEWQLHTFDRLERDWVKIARQSTQGVEIHARLDEVDAT